MNVTVSLVSHGHGAMVWRLVDQLLACPEVAQVIVTLNIPEYSPEIVHDQVVLVKNDVPKGFGANHNAAFSRAKTELYCVVNPDIELVQNPFNALAGILADQRVGLAAPLVIGANGVPEDSMRRFLTLWSMLKRVLGWDSGGYSYSLQKSVSVFTPDWVAGMCMLFRSETYAKLDGFDERYFMYCEDADICIRIWKSGYRVVGCLSTSVIHNAQRASHRSLKHLLWHLRSVVRYFLSHSYSLPTKYVVKS